MSKLCECGCGGEVKFNSRSKQPNKFIMGHNRKGKVSCRKGKKLSKESKLKMSESHKGQGIGKPCSLKRRLAISKAKKEKMFKYSEESKLKMRISRIKYIEKTFFNGSPVVPNIGKNETQILNRFQNELNIEIIRNDYNIAINTGRFPDGYILEYNLVIEVLEPHHFKSNNELSYNDQKREIAIASKLCCMIYYISEQEFLHNPNKEIKRFKDFLLLLKEKTN